MDFAQLIAPMAIDDFRDRYRRGVCFFVRGAPDKFSDLITLQEIEDRLNEGCNINSPVQIIQDGVRRPLTSDHHYWSPKAIKKGEIKQLIEQRRSFLMVNMSQINPRVAQLLDSIEAFFRDDRLHADLHLYVSTTRSATAYNAHRDQPQHKIYLQVIGRTEWRLYEPTVALPADTVAIPANEEAATLREIAQFTLNPGDLFYMPPAVFHKIRNLGGPRVSFSIPCAPGREHTQYMDRTHIPFKAIFQAEQDAAAQETPEQPRDDSEVTVAHGRWSV